MPAASSSPTLTVVDDSDPLLGELAEGPAAPAGLLETLARIPDPRKRRGKRHHLPAVLAVALAATLAGARSFVAIAEWAADAAPEARTRLGITGAVPSESTIRRCLQQLAPDQFDELIGAWMWLRTSVIDGQRVIAFDGKTPRERIRAEVAQGAVSSASAINLARTRSGRSSMTKCPESTGSNV